MRRFLRLGIQRALSSSSHPSSSPNLSIWRGKRKEIGKEGLMVVQEMKRLQNSAPERLQSFIKSRVSRLLKSDLLAVLVEFQKQDHVSLCLMKQLAGERTLLLVLHLIRLFLGFESHPADYGGLQ